MSRSSRAPTPGSAKKGNRDGDHRTRRGEAPQSQHRQQHGYEFRAGIEIKRATRESRVASALWSRGTAMEATRSGGTAPSLPAPHVPARTGGTPIEGAVGYAFLYGVACAMIWSRLDSIVSFVLLGDDAASQAGVYHADSLYVTIWLCVVAVLLAAFPVGALVVAWVGRRRRGAGGSLWGMLAALALM